MNQLNIRSLLGRHFDVRFQWLAHSLSHRHRQTWRWWGSGHTRFPVHHEALHPFKHQQHRVSVGESPICGRFHGRVWGDAESGGNSFQRTNGVFIGHILESNLNQLHKLIYTKFKVCLHLPQKWCECVRSSRLQRRCAGYRWQHGPCPIAQEVWPPMRSGQGRSGNPNLLSLKWMKLKNKSELKLKHYWYQQVKVWINRETE